MQGIGDAGLFWWPTEDIWVVSLFGSPNVEDAGVLTRRFTDNARRSIPHSTLFDVRALVTVSPEPLGHLSSYVGEHRENIESRLERVAVVHRGDLSRAISHGVKAMTGMTVPLEFFTEPEPAFAWLDAAEPATLASELERRIEQARAGLPALRDYLRANMTASLDEAARALGFSSRQLQRVLKGLETSYRDERSRVRVEIAKQLLLTTDLKVEAVATEVGYAKLQNFVDAFRKITGDTPATWRSAQPSGSEQIAKLRE